MWKGDPTVLSLSFVQILGWGGEEQVCDGESSSPATNKSILKVNKGAHTVAAACAAA
jgi:hypothetical protein